MTIDEMERRLKCSREWVQLSIDAGFPQDAEGRINIREFMLFPLSNIHRIRKLAGLSPIETVRKLSDLRPNVKAILTTQFECLRARFTKCSVKQGEKWSMTRCVPLNKYRNSALYGCHQYTDCLSVWLVLCSEIWSEAKYVILVFFWCCARLQCWSS